ncbi:MAG: sulfotransferase [Candidatus Levybacteria bacterium]|nr:sulfotransferase [Candidatus Levybacteria bacterium]
MSNIMISKNFNLILISAMYENGGNTLHRFFDGHPELFVYPFESQPGTSLVSDYLTSVFPIKYRWPEFSLNGTVDQDYELIIDEELKRHIKTPLASKFRDAELGFSDQDRKKLFLQYMKGKDRSRKNLVEAFFVSTFQAWKTYKKSGKEKAYVGYSPIIGVDGEKILSDFPNGHVLHVIRNPYSAYADTKKRAVPYSLSKYIHIWSIMQLTAITYANMFPNNFHIVRFEEMVENPNKYFKSLAKKLGISYSPTMEYPSWNGRKLENIVPWGTVQTPTTQANIATKNELTDKEIQDIKKRTYAINKILGYEKE